MPTEVVWTQELIRRFWDGLAETPVLEKLSFARMAAGNIVNLAQPYLSRNADCLDYGGGSGHLAEALISAQYRSASFEPSPARAALIEERLGRQDGFIGVIGPDNAASFDALFCLEVIEHIPEEDLGEFLQDINRRIREGGIIFLTCPYNEDLETGMVFCPICESTFHRWQHLRSLKASTVRNLLEQAGFDTVFQGLAGFGSASAIDKFLTRDQTVPWPNNVIDETGRAIPIIGSSGHIVYVGRKVRAAGKVSVSAILNPAAAEACSSLNPHKPTFAAVVERARLVARPAMVVLPAAAEADWPSDVRVLVVPRAFPLEDSGRPEDAGDESRGPTAARDSEVIVYPSSFAGYDEARRRGVLPDASEIHLFEGGDWKIARRCAAHAGAVPGEPAGRSSSRLAKAIQLGERLSPGYRQHLRRTLQRLAQHRKARSIQRFADFREQGLSTLLHSPVDFPYRLSHIVEKRVVLAISSLYNGGAERQTIYTAEGLRKCGLSDVHILVEYLHNQKVNSYYLPAARAAAATITELSDAGNPHKAWTREHPALFNVLHDDISNRVLNTAAYLQKMAPEIVHASLDWTNATVGLAAALAGVPHIFLSGRNLAPIHFGFFNWFLYPVYRALFQQPNVTLLNNSEAGATDYSLWLQVPNDRIKLLRNGFDFSRFPRATEKLRRQARVHYGIPDEAKVVVGAFRLSEEKRPFMWIEAAACILQREPNAFFVVFGDGPLRYATKQLAWSRGIGERIIFPGIRNIPFAVADLVMLTSLKEGTPNVLIEAQASGIPVVATAAYGSAEAVDDGITGYIVRNETAEEVAAAALVVLRDPVLRARAADAGPAFIERRFGLRRMVEDTLRIYAASGVSWAASVNPPSS